MNNELDELIEKLNIYLGDERYDKISKKLNKAYPSDIAYAASRIEADYLEKFFELLLLSDNMSLIIVEFEKYTLEEFINFIRDKQNDRISEIIQALDIDDQVYLISSLTADLQSWILDALPEDASKDIETLFEYAEGQAGRIMSTDFFIVNEDTTVLEAFTALKENHDAEMIYCIYVVDDYNHLLGVCSLRDLLKQPNSAQIKDFMVQDVISVSALQDREEVALIVERHNLTAVPVVSKKNKILGIITVDDVIDIIREETTEDILKLAGTNEDEYSVPSPFKGFIRRMPWLMVSFFGGLITVQSMNFFSQRLEQVVLLAFVPIIAGMGGNISSQSSTIIVRGLATGRIYTSELFKVLLKEVLTATFLGLAFGGMLGGMAILQFSEIRLIGLTVGIGMFFSMLVAATVGSLIPMLFYKFKIDPAVATGPFVSTTIDNIGLFGYLGCSMFLMN